MELVVLCGLQASGKSTFRRALLAGHVVVSKDLMGRAKRKEARQRRLIAEALAEGRDVVVDNTNPTVAERAAIIDIGRAHGARLVGYYFDSVFEDCARRNAARPGREVVPEVGLADTRARFALPSWEEGFSELWRVRIGVVGGFEVSAWAGEG